MNELDTRDVVSASIIREMRGGPCIRTMSGRVRCVAGYASLGRRTRAGTVEKAFPAMVMQFDRFGIDISKDPVLIIRRLHYQRRRR